MNAEIADISKKQLTGANFGIKVDFSDTEVTIDGVFNAVKN